MYETHTTVIFDFGLYFFGSRLYRRRPAYFAYGAVFSADGVLFRKFVREAPRLVCGNEALQKESGILCRKKGYDSADKGWHYHPCDNSDGLRVLYDVAKRTYRALRNSCRCVGLPYGVFSVRSQDDLLDCAVWKRQGTNGRMR